MPRFASREVLIKSMFSRIKKGRLSAPGLSSGEAGNLPSLKALPTQCLI